MRSRNGPQAGRQAAAGYGPGAPYDPTPVSPARLRAQQKLGPALIPPQQPTGQTAQVQFFLFPLHIPQAVDSQRHLLPPPARIPSLPQPRQRGLKAPDQLGLQSQHHGPRRQLLMTGDSPRRPHIPRDHQVPGPPQHISHPFIRLDHGSLPPDRPPIGHHSGGPRIHNGRELPSSRLLIAAGVRGRGQVLDLPSLVHLVRRAGLRRLAGHLRRGAQLLRMRQARSNLSRASAGRSACHRRRPGFPGPGRARNAPSRSKYRRSPARAPSSAAIPFISDPIPGMPPVQPMATGSPHQGQQSGGPTAPCWRHRGMMMGGSILTHISKPP